MEGLLALIPIAVVIIVAVVTKRTFDSLVIGVVVGFFVVGHGNPLEAFNGFVASLYTVMASEDTVWVLLICGLMGSLIALMGDSNGVSGFLRLVEGAVKSRKSAILFSWILGIIIFVDDYLNCLVIGATMRKLTDRHGISREMLAYIVNSTGVTCCAIIPFSSWSAFMSGQMETADMLGGSTPFAAYASAVPFMFYAWLAVIAVPLFALKVLPQFGPMKKAEARALEGKPMSEEAIKEFHGGDMDTDEVAAEKDKTVPKWKVVNFLIPIVVFAALTIITDDMLNGLLISIVLCVILYLPQKAMNIGGYFGSIMKGLLDMLPVIVIIILAYMLIDINDQLGLIDYVVGFLGDIVNPALLPVIIFVTIGLLSLATGTFWGLAAIAFPIVGALAAGLGANPSLCAGALVSAVCFGGHICLYSDTVILTSASTQSTIAEYFKTSFPLVIVTAIAAAILFLAAGFIF